MANHTPSTGYPFGNKDPYPHEATNDVSEKIVKSHNADEGSDHAPSGTSTWSGAGGFGFSFADLFPFDGEIDVSAGLVCTAPVAGSLIFDQLVAVDVRGPLTFKGAGAGGAPGTCSFNGTSSCTFFLGSVLTLASGSTCNLSGATYVRGVLTIKASGGPGSLVVEAGCTASIAGSMTVTGNVALVGGDMTLDATSTLIAASGSQSSFNGGSQVLFYGSTAFQSSTNPILSPARPWTRRANRIAATTYDGVNPQTFPIFSPFFSNAPAFFCTGGIASVTQHCLLEFDLPPDAGEMVEVVVASVGYLSETIGTLPTYRIVKLTDGLDDDLTNMSSVITDAHTGVAANWVTLVSTTIPVTSNATVDRGARYALLVTFARDAGNTKSFYMNAVATGTIDKLKGL